MTWDRSAKNAALVFLAYLLLVGAGAGLWRLGRAVTRNTGDAPAAHPQPRRAPFPAAPASRGDWTGSRPLRASLFVCAGGHT